jgi:hypothetical protein
MLRRRSGILNEILRVPQLTRACSAGEEADRQVHSGAGDSLTDKIAHFNVVILNGRSCSLTSLGTFETCGLLNHVGLCSTILRYMRMPTDVFGLTPPTRPDLCHSWALLSLRLTSRTIWSIWNGCKRLGSFSNVARHFAKTVSGLFCSCVHSSMICWMVTSHSSRRIGNPFLSATSPARTPKRLRKEATMFYRLVRSVQQDGESWPLSHAVVELSRGHQGA